MSLALSWPPVAAARSVPACLTIAGSDSGGGAGIQADLKAFARCGAHGMSAITAITAQNTVAVEAVLAIPPEMIVAQVRAVATDIGVDGVKVGMLGDETTIDAVLEALSLLGDPPVVVDPVMVSESGASLLDPNAKAALIERVIPRASVLTPNLAEARALSGLGEGASQRELGEALLGLGARAVIVTGGHTEEGSDLLVDHGGALSIEGPRYPGAPRTARAAPIPPRCAPISPAARSSPRPRAGPRRSPPRRSATACARSGVAPGRWTCSGSGAIIALDEAGADESRPR